MPTTFDEFVLNVRFADMLDVGIVAGLLYLGLGWMRRRAARAVVVGLVLVGLVYVVAHVLSMYLLLAIFRTGLALVLFSLVVIYREDIRHGLERLSFGWPFVSAGAEGPSDDFRATLVESVMALAERSMGGLIVLRGRHSLERHVRGGIPLDAEISLPLVLSLFHHETPGHDGAIIVHDGRLVAFGVHLPLSTNLGEVGSGGTRHTAALGLAERCDALVICVSEERGTVSVAEEGRLVVLAGAPEVERRLHDFFDGTRTTPLAGTGSGVGERLISFVACLSVALLLWFVFAFRVETVRRVFADVPVEIRQLPEEWSIDVVEPSSITVTIVGPERAVRTIDREQLRLSLAAKDPQPGERDIAVTARELGLPDGVRLLSSDPAAIRLDLSRVERATLPIEVRRRGSPPEGMTASVTATPPEVAVFVSEAALDWNRAIATEPVDVSTPAVHEIGLVLPRGVRLVDPSTATVRIEVRHTPASEPPDR